MTVNLPENLILTFKSNALVCNVASCWKGLACNGVWLVQNLYSQPCRKILSTWELLKDFIFSLQAQKPPVQDWIFTSEKKYIRMLPDHVSEADVDLLLGLGLGWWCFLHKFWVFNFQQCINFLMGIMRNEIVKTLEGRFSYKIIARFSKNLQNKSIILTEMRFKQAYIHALFGLMEIKYDRTCFFPCELLYTTP